MWIDVGLFMFGALVGGGLGFVAGILVVVYMSGLLIKDAGKENPKESTEWKV